LLYLKQKMKIVLLVTLLVSMSLAMTIRYKSNTTHEENLKYWTRERMASAIPRDIVFKTHLSNNFEYTGINEEETAQVNPPKGTTNVNVGDYTKNPYHQVGKVFFSHGPNNYVCSGSAVGGNIVLTAGHCVCDSGSWFTKWLFVPNYLDGKAPFGTYSAEDVFAFQDWFYDSDIGRDVAFAQVKGSTSDTLEKVVGALGFITNVESNKTNWAAVGYPAANPFTGKVMVQSFEAQSITDNRVSPFTRGIISKMTGGCSGGPWVYSVDVGADNSNTVNAAGGLNSYGYQGRPHLYSPLFDDSVNTLYQQARAADK